MANSVFWTCRIMQTSPTWQTWFQSQCRFLSQSGHTKPMKNITQHEIYNVSALSRLLKHEEHGKICIIRFVKYSFLSQKQHTATKNLQYQAELLSCKKNLHVLISSNSSNKSKKIWFSKPVVNSILLNHNTATYGWLIHWSIDAVSPVRDYCNQGRSRWGASNLSSLSLVPSAFEQGGIGSWSCKPCFDRRPRLTKSSPNDRYLPV